jgi:hypothetical protein
MDLITNLLQDVEFLTELRGFAMIHALFVVMTLFTYWRLKDLPWISLVHLGIFASGTLGAYIAWINNPQPDTWTFVFGGVAGWVVCAAAVVNIYVITLVLAVVVRAAWYSHREKRATSRQAV